jgi:hypothetical protein
VKLFIAIVCLFFLLPGLVAAQSPAQPVPAQAANQPTATPSGASPTQTKIDPAKEADIRHLLDVMGSRKLMSETMDAMTNSIRPLMANALPPGEYREQLIDLFFAKFRAKADLQYLLDSGVRLYDKYFSHNEIKDMIKFYETPVGQKAASLMPQLTNEMRQAGEKWGEKLGRESMQEVLAEHPEMQKALEDAGKAAQQK